LDTAKDARVLVLEDALSRLNEIVGNRKIRMHIEYSKLISALKKAGSLLYEVKYSYIDAKALAEHKATRNLLSAISEFSDLFRVAVKSQAYKPQTVNERMALTEVQYALAIVEGFEQRLQESDDDPAYAIDILSVEISQTKAVEGSTNLTECRCTDGSRIWTIVTNIPGIEAGKKLPCAVLPPANMMGIVSEAMFLGAEPLPETAELGPLKEPPSNALDQARAQVLQITKRMT
jgi:predicted RNA-binding protein with EMAP domain